MYRAVANQIKLRADETEREFTFLYEQLADRVTRYIAVRVGTAQVAEDLTAQTFIKVFEAMRRGKRGRNMYAWVFGVARHVVADHYRHRRHQNVSLEAVGDVAASEPSLEDIADRGLRLERVAAALAALAPDRAEALALRIFGGLSTVEVAKVLGKSEGAVKMLVYRGVQDLQERLGGL